MEVGSLLPPRVKVFALPNTHRPKLYVVGATSTQRWKKSSLYPAFRLSAKMYRLFVRMRVATGYSSFWTNQISPWVVEEFVRDVFSSLKSSVVLVGTPGPAQKMIIELWNDVHVIGYIKYAESPRACTLLKREHRILSQLPKGLGPTVYKYGSMREGIALLTSPIQGQRLSSLLPISAKVLALTQTFETSNMKTVDTHPMLQAYRSSSHQCVHSWLDALSSREWPVVFHHGDFTPWNIISEKSGKLRAFDWEYGHVAGFPFLDILHYIFQVSRLIYYWSPEKTRAYAFDVLRQMTHYQLNSSEAKALISLSAYQDFLHAMEDGHSPTDLPQLWRKKLWKP